MTRSEAPGGARLMIGFDGSEATCELGALLRETGARAVILFARNLKSAAQARELIAALRALVPWPLVVAVDQEGGLVVRLTAGVTVFPGNLALGACDDERLAYQQGYECGRQLRAIGFDLNLAPVIDLFSRRSPAVGLRSFGASASRVPALATALVEGHRDAGIACCLKHFPGLGAASVDPHEGAAVVDLTREALAVHAKVFGDVPTAAVMTTHVTVRALDPELPVTLSRAVLATLDPRAADAERVVIADDLEMGAITRHFDVASASVRAAQAGHDLLPVCHDPARQRAAARALDAALATGALDPEAHARAVARLGRLAAPGERPALVTPGAGDAVARRIAERAVHVFGDPGRLLPLAGRVLVLVPEALEAGVALEGTGGWLPLVRQSLERGGLGGFELRAFVAALADPALPDPGVLADAGSFDRVVLLSTGSRAGSGMRSLLETACRTLAGRLVVAHLRDPIDQARVPAAVTALTSFGFRACQLEALAGVLAGRLAAAGRLPAMLP